MASAMDWLTTPRPSPGWDLLRQFLLNMPFGASYGPPGTPTPKMTLGEILKPAQEDRQQQALWTFAKQRGWLPDDFDPSTLRGSGLKAETLLPLLTKDMDKVPLNRYPGVVEDFFPRLKAPQEQVPLFEPPEATGEPWPSGQFETRTGPRPPALEAEYQAAGRERLPLLKILEQIQERSQERDWSEMWRRPAMGLSEEVRRTIGPRVSKEEHLTYKTMMGKAAEARERVEAEGRRAEESDRRFLRNQKAITENMIKGLNLQATSKEQAEELKGTKRVQSILANPEMPDQVKRQVQGLPSISESFYSKLMSEAMQIRSNQRLLPVRMQWDQNMAEMRDIRFNLGMAGAEQKGALERRIRQIEAENQLLMEQLRQGGGELPPQGSQQFFKSAP